MTQPTEPPLIALHGFLGCAADWDEVFEDLRRDRICLALDLPGHGDQPVPPPGDGVQALAERLVALTEGLGEVDYVGYSMGGRLLYQLITDPRLQPWRRMVLIGAHAGLEDEAERATRRLQDDFIAQQLDEGDYASFLTRWYAQPLFGDIQQAPGYAAMLERRLGNEPHALAGALRQLGTGVLPPCWEVLPEVRPPLLLLAGEHDQKYSKLNERAARLLPRGRTEFVAGTSHAPQVEAPQKLTAALRQFLAG